MLEVVLYSRSGCADCDQARQLLAAKKVEFTEIDVDTRPELRQHLFEKSHSEQLPQLLIGEHRIIGLAALQALAQNYQLDGMLVEE